MFSIEEITAGMLVYAHNPDTGETELKEVVQTFVNETNELVHIKVSGEEIITTPTHPFWVPQKGWTDAIQLRAGDRLQLLNGEYVIIEQVQHEILEAPVTVYNFEVEDFHTYFVGETSVLVHNDCGPKNKMTFETRKQAFNEAKRQIGVPTSAQPTRIGPNITRQGQIAPGRVYYFDNGNYIRDDISGHIFPDGGHIGSHFNIGYTYIL